MYLSSKIVKRLKPIIFISFLIPSVLWFYQFINNNLGVNPIDKLMDKLGEFTLQLLIFTLIVSDLSKLKSLRSLQLLRRMTPDNDTSVFDNAPDVNIDPVPMTQLATNTHQQQYSMELNSPLQCQSSQADIRSKHSSIADPPRYCVPIGIICAGQSIQSTTAIIKEPCLLCL